MELHEKKIWLFGIFSACPLNYALDDCIFSKYRKLSSLERWEYIDSLNLSEVDALIRHHRECIYKRELGQKSCCKSFDAIKKTG